MNKLSWKDELPENLRDEWKNFHERLSEVNEVMGVEVQIQQATSVLALRRLVTL